MTERGEKLSITATGDRLIERLDRMESSVLQGFHEYTRKVEAAIQTQQALVSSLEDRLATLEERIDALEQKHVAGAGRSNRRGNKAKALRSPSVH